MLPRRIPQIVPAWQVPRRNWRAALGVAVIVLLLTTTGVADRWELPFRDALLRAAPRHRPVFTVAVVVDDAALARFGRFPWPRERLAEVVSAVAEAGARGLVVDFFPAEPAPGDQALASALRRLPSVLAAVPAAKGHGWLRPAPRLAAAADLAHAAYHPDHDGVVRRLAATKQAEGEALPALPLAAAVLIHPRPIPGGAVLRPDFLTRTRDIPQVSVVEVLSGASGARLQDRVVFLGATAAGLGDRVMTPTSPPGSPDPGVLVQAAIPECLLRGGCCGGSPPGSALSSPDWLFRPSNGSGAGGGFPSGRPCRWPSSCRW